MVNMDETWKNKYDCRFDIKNLVTTYCKNDDEKKYYLSVDSFESFLLKRFSYRDAVAQTSSESPMKIYEYEDRYLTLIIDKTGIMQEVHI